MPPSPFCGSVPCLGWTIYFDLIPYQCTYLIVLKRIYCNTEARLDQRRSHRIAPQATDSILVPLSIVFCPKSPPNMQENSNLLRIRYVPNQLLYVELQYSTLALISVHKFDCLHDALSNYPAIST